MELSTKQIIRCNKLMYCIINVLCFFYMTNMTFTIDHSVN